MSKATLGCYLATFTRGWAITELPSPATNAQLRVTIWLLAKSTPRWLWPWEIWADVIVSLATSRWGQPTRKLGWRWRESVAIRRCSRRVLQIWRVRLARQEYLRPEACHSCANPW